MNRHFTNTYIVPVKPFATTPGPFERVQQHVIRHVHACIDSRGGQFELLS
jgi:hypothetical protein